MSKPPCGFSELLWCRFFASSGVIILPHNIFSSNNVWNGFCRQLYKWRMWVWHAHQCWLRSEVRNVSKKYWLLQQRTKKEKQTKLHNRRKRIGDVPALTLVPLRYSCRNIPDRDCFTHLRVKHSIASFLLRSAKYLLLLSSFLVALLLGLVVKLLVVCSVWFNISLYMATSSALDCRCSSSNLLRKRGSNWWCSSCLVRVFYALQLVST